MWRSFTRQKIIKRTRSYVTEICFFFFVLFFLQFPDAGSSLLKSPCWFPALCSSSAKGSRRVKVTELWCVSMKPWTPFKCLTVTSPIAPWCPVISSHFHSLCLYKAWRAEPRRCLLHGLLKRDAGFYRCYIMRHIFYKAAENQANYFWKPRKLRVRRACQKQQNLHSSKRGSFCLQLSGIRRYK